MKTFEPLRSWIGRGERLSEADAFTARDPADPPLPPRRAARPAAADGAVAGGLAGQGGPRSSAARSIAALLPASEQWLDRHATNENGPLPKPGAELARRFGEP